MGTEPLVGGNSPMSPLTLSVGVLVACNLECCFIYFQLEVLHAALREDDVEKNRTFFYLRESRVQRDELPPPDSDEEEEEMAVEKSVVSAFTGEKKKVCSSG